MVGRTAPELTVGRLFIRYRTEHLTYLKSGDRIERSLGVLLADDLGKSAAALSADDIAAAVARVATTGRTHANRCLAYLRAFLAWAVGVGLLQANPAIDVSMPSDEIRRERTLTLEEIVDVWQAAEVLDYPFSPAIRVMLLTGMRREQVASMRVSDVEFGEFSSMGIWRLPAHSNDFAKTFDVALSGLARTEIFQASSKSPRRSRYVFSTTGATPISGWTRPKRRLDAEISRLRMSSNRPVMPSWRLDDLRRSLVANVEEHLGLDHGVAMSCLHVQSGFGSLRQRFIAYSSCADGCRAEILAAWSRLIDGASRPGVRLNQVLSVVKREASLRSLEAWLLDDLILSDEVSSEMWRRGL